MLINRFDDYAEDDDIVSRLHDKKKHLPWQFGQENHALRFVRYRGKKCTYYRYDNPNMSLAEVLEFIARRSSIIRASRSTTTGTSTYTAIITDSGATYGSSTFAIKRRASYFDATDFFSYK